MMERVCFECALAIRNTNSRGVTELEELEFVYHLVVICIVVVNSWIVVVCLSFSSNMHSSSSYII
jgi:hypothetical protein